MLWIVPDKLADLADVCQVCFVLKKRSDPREYARVGITLKEVASNEQERPDTESESPKSDPTTSDRGDSGRDVGDDPNGSSLW